MPKKKKAGKTRGGRLRSKQALADVAKVLQASKTMKVGLKKIKKHLEAWCKDPHQFL